MPDYPPAIIARAAEAVERELMSDISYDMHLDSDEAIARAVLDAIAEQLGQHVAAKIKAHQDEWGSKIKPGKDRRAWDRHFGIARRVASGAFLTDEDRLRIAARELAAGNAVACTGPEVPGDGTREH